MNKEMCIKVGKWNNSLLWCMVEKHQNANCSWQASVYNMMSVKRVHIVKGIRRKIYKSNTFF